MNIVKIAHQPFTVTQPKFITPESRETDHMIKLMEGRLFVWMVAVP